MTDIIDDSTHYEPKPDVYVQCVKTEAEEGFVALAIPPQGVPQDDVLLNLEVYKTTTKTPDGELVTQQDIDLDGADQLLREKYHFNTELKGVFQQCDDEPGDIVRVNGLAGKLLRRRFAELGLDIMI